MSQTNDFELAIADCKPIINYQVRKYQKAIGTSTEQAQADVMFSAWMIFRRWRVDGGDKFSSMLYRYLQADSLRLNKIRKDEVLTAFEEHFEGEEGVGEKHQKNITLRAHQYHDTRREVEDLVRIIPDPSVFQECLIQHWAGGYTYKQAIRRTNSIFPLIDRRELTKIAFRTKSYLREHFNVLEEDTQ